MVQLGLDAALKRRELALDSLEERYPNFLDRARAVAVSVAKRKGWVTADDVRAVLEIPPDVHHNVMGAVFMSSLFIDAGPYISAQRQGHGNRIRIWRLRDD